MLFKLPVADEDILANIGPVTQISQPLKMTGETPEVHSNKKKPKEDRQNHRYHRYCRYHGSHMGPNTLK